MNFNPLNFFFDLSRNGLNYGIVYSLSLAETERMSLGIESFDFSVVPASNDSFFASRSNRDKHYDAAQKEWRLYNLVVPAARLFPAVREIHLHSSRDNAKASLNSSLFCYPINYSVDHPRKKVGSFQQLLDQAREGGDVQHVQAPQFALQTMRQWLKQNACIENTITITLRQSDLQPDRNSNIKEWLELASHMEKVGFKPVFICDTELILFGTSGLPNTAIRCDLASLNIELRCALYELSKLNFFVSNGPLSLALCDKKISYISCKWLVDKYKNTTEDFFKKMGFLREGQMPNRKNPYGEILWETDRSDYLIHSFELWLNSNS